MSDCKKEAGLMRFVSLQDAAAALSSGRTPALSMSAQELGDAVRNSDTWWRTRVAEEILLRADA